MHVNWSSKGDGVRARLYPRGLCWAPAVSRAVAFRLCRASGSEVAGPLRGPRSLLPPLLLCVARAVGFSARVSFGRPGTRLPADFRPSLGSLLIPGDARGGCL